MLGAFVSTVITQVGAAVIAIMVVELNENRKLEEKLRDPAVNAGPNRLRRFTSYWWSKENQKLPVPATNKPVAE